MQYYPKRKTVRLQDFDYGGEHSYFITVCAHLRQPLFGEIREGIMCLNDLGAIVWAEWEKSFIMRPHYIPHAFVVMPNHLHALFSITRPPDGYNPARVAGFCKHPKDTISTMIGGAKSAVTSYSRKELEMDGEIWQERFYDHIVRSWPAFDKIEQYINNNTRNWMDDCFYQ